MRLGDEDPSGEPENLALEQVGQNLALEHRPPTSNLPAPVTVARTLSRLGVETLPIAFFAVCERGLSYLFAYLGVLGSWWAPIILRSTEAFAVIGIIWIGIVEMTRLMVDSALDLRRHIRQRPSDEQT